ncbi:MAG: NUDIX hydrolase [Thermogemmatispora sp.]|uniref:NUDIX hydrolase n=1 Tax=Thermogemmatispora sp. TaxID=1968838 RepID=UPI002627393D|nr:NUDIX hydrolase [Thermogemmatispora sp.]MBX5457322.1 NUDIX hydrolase [Thermogemmatispora sp.]
MTTDHHLARQQAPSGLRPWVTRAAERVLDTPYLKVRREEVLLPDGTLIPDYYIIENRGWVGIVPLTSDGRFLLNRQYKHGIGLEVLEFPAGAIDPHEDDPLLTAHRELMEETGYSVAAEKIELLAHMYANPTGARTRIWWYLARDVEKTGEQKVDPREVIENLLVTPRELLALIHSGQFAVQGQIAAAYMALERLGYLRASF